MDSSAGLIEVDSNDSIAMATVATRQQLQVAGTLKTVKIEIGETTVLQRDAGAIFRATSLGTGSDAMNGYYAGLNESGDALVLGRMNGTWTQLASVPLTIATNTSYHLKVVAVGSDIRVYVSDMNVPKIHVTDTTWTSGAVGVRAHFTNASFDNVAVTK